MSNRNQIWQDIELAIRADKRNHPSWPDHAAAQAGKVTVPCGKLATAAMDYKYGPVDHQKINHEMMRQYAIDTAAAAIRFLENLK